jgi:hypothetical protein
MFSPVLEVKVSDTLPQNLPKLRCKIFAKWLLSDTPYIAAGLVGVASGVGLMSLATLGQEWNNVAVPLSGLSIVPLALFLGKNQRRHIIPIIFFTTLCIIPSFRKVANIVVGLAYCYFSCSVIKILLQKASNSAVPAIENEIRQWFDQNRSWYLMKLHMDKMKVRSWTVSTFGVFGHRAHPIFVSDRRDMAIMELANRKLATELNYKESWSITTTDDQWKGDYLIPQEGYTHCITEINRYRQLRLQENHEELEANPDRRSVRPEDLSFGYFGFGREDRA